MNAVQTFSPPPLASVQKCLLLHVAMFTPEVEPEEHEVARLLGYPDAHGMFFDLYERSVEAFAVCAEVAPGAWHGKRVIALAGLLEGGRLWLHMPPLFKQLAGVGTLRLMKRQLQVWLKAHGELLIDVEASKGDLVRMADWLGFKRCAPDVEKFGRVFHQCRLRRPT